MSLEMQGIRGPTGTSGTSDMNLTRIVPASVSQCACAGFMLSRGQPAFLKSKRTWLLTEPTLYVTELQPLQRCYLWAKPNPREGPQLVQLGQLLAVLQKHGGDHWYMAGTGKGLCQEESGKTKQPLPK